jgi:two-component system, cell cycle response regulator DivK
MASSPQAFPPSPRILIIEDDYANRLLFFDYLTFAGFSVLALSDGLNLRQALDDFQPDALVLDLGLPEPDGYHILESLQTPWGALLLPVVVVSGYAFFENQERALALGARRYLVKPVRLKELARTLREVTAS